MANGNFAGGSGTLTDPYLIEDARDLNAMRNNLSSHYKLVNDIDMNVSPYNEGTGWVPVGESTGSRYFTGSLDGSGYTITGLFINRPGVNYAALFGVISGALIRELVLVGVTIIGGNYTGALAGAVTGATITTITDCHAQGNVTGAAETGGLVGFTTIADIEKCSADVTVSGTSETGGLIGMMRAGTGVSDIRRCHSKGNVSGSFSVGGLTGRIENDNNVRECYSLSEVGATGARVGGFVGYITGRNIVIMDCYARGLVKSTSTGIYYGGFIGGHTTTSEGKVINCYSTGFVDRTGATGGGFAGDFALEVNFINCYWDMESSGKTTSSGEAVGKTTIQMKEKATFNGWDTAYWAFLGDYPVLVHYTVKKYLIEVGGEVKTYGNGEWATVGTSPATYEMYNDFGMTRLDKITQAGWEKLPDSFNILEWAEATEKNNPVYELKVAPFKPIMLLSPREISVIKWTNSPQARLANAVPLMTGHTTPRGEAKASSEYGTSNGAAWKAFNGIDLGSWTESWITKVGDKTNQWLSYKFTEPVAVKGYLIASSTEAVSESPKDWDFQGSNNETDWVTLHTVSNVTIDDWTRIRYREYSIPNTEEYLYYRLYVYSQNGHANNIGVGELQLLAETTKQMTVGGLVRPILKYKVELLNPPTVLQNWTETQATVSKEAILPKSYINSIDPYIIKITATNNITEYTEEKTATVLLDDIAPTITPLMAGMRLDFHIEDPDGDRIRFKVILNGSQIHPAVAGNFTDLQESPVSYSRLFNSEEANVGTNNTLQVIAQDEFGKESSVHLEFVGEYAGILFADEFDNLYSDDIGNILQYLDVETLVAGQTSDTYPIKLINKTGFIMQNIQLWKDRKSLPPSADVEISRTDLPFIPIDLLELSEPLGYNEEVTFYVRIVTQINGQPGQGNFDVLVKADPS